LPGIHKRRHDWRKRMEFTNLIVDFNKELILKRIKSIAEKKDNFIL
jgi:hypothetical protein